MKAARFPSLLLIAALASVAAAQTFSPRKGGGLHPSQQPPASEPKNSVVVDISDSAIANDFEAPKEDAPEGSLNLSPAAESPKGKEKEKAKDKEKAKEPEKENKIQPAPLPPAETEAPAVEQAPASERDSGPEGVIARVEPGAAGVAAVDASKVKLLAPFPAKAMARTPVGWHLERPENVPPLTQEVTLENGTALKLSIRPHVLVPDADGSQVIAANEPGYDASLQYAQTKTMGALLSHSLEQMDKDSKDLGDALERLQQLLGSLPHPAPAPTPAAAPSGKNPR